MSWQSRAPESLKNQPWVPFAAGEEPVLRRRCSGHGACVSPSCLWPPSDAAWLCAAPEAAVCLYGGFKMQVWTRAFPTCLQKQSFVGRGSPGVCVGSLWELGTPLSPGLVSLGMRSTRTGILAAMFYPPNLVILKPELQKLLISLF